MAGDENYIYNKFKKLVVYNTKEKYKQHLADKPDEDEPEWVERSVLAAEFLHQWREAACKAEMTIEDEAIRNHHLERIKRSKVGTVLHPTIDSIPLEFKLSKYRSFFKPLFQTAYNWAYYPNIKSYSTQQVKFLMAAIEMDEIFQQVFQVNIARDVMERVDELLEPHLQGKIRDLTMLPEFHGEMPEISIPVASNIAQTEVEALELDLKIALGNLAKLAHKYGIVVDSSKKMTTNVVDGFRILAMVRNCDKTVL
jgi:hypothetical protein